MQVVLIQLCLYGQSLHGLLQTSIDGDDSMGPEDMRTRFFDQKQVKSTCLDVYTVRYRLPLHTAHYTHWKKP